MDYLIEFKFGYFAINQVNPKPTRLVKTCFKTAIVVYCCELNNTCDL